MSLNTRIYCARCVVLLATISLLPALADTILSTGFEAPTYNPGTLRGQNGWFGPSTVPVVENTTFFAGSQAVAYDSTGVSGQDAVFKNFSYDPTGQIVTESVEFMEGTGSQPIWVPVAAYDPTFIAALLVSGGDATLGLASSTVGSVPINVGQWYDLQLVLDYPAQMAYGYVDSTLIGSGAFAAPGLSTVGFGINDSSRNTAVGYFDNLSVTATTAPEPSAFAMALLGLLPVAWEARRRRAFPDRGRIR